MAHDLTLHIMVALAMAIWFAASINAIRKAPQDPHDGPEHQERPTLPRDFRPVKHKALGDRLARGFDVGEARRRWGSKQEIERMCSDIAEGRKP